MDNTTSIMQIKGIGEKTASYFSKLGISNVGELIHFYPREYDKYEEPVKICSTVPGEIAAVYAAITGVISERKIRHLSILTFSISDGTGILQLTYFNMPFLKKILKPGGYYVFRGRVQSKGISLVMEQAAYFGREEYLKQTKSLLPKYPLTKGLSNTTLQKSIHTALSQTAFEPEFFSSDFCEKYHLISEKEALGIIHGPQTTEDLLIARRRLVFEEFFSFIYMLRQNSKFSEGLANEYPMFETADTVRFLEQLPYSLTTAQKKVWQEIRNDFGSQYCMNRLIQGDVGSGKTILAVLALIMTAANGYQGAMMAPTEVLAVQHYESLLSYVNKYHVRISPVLLVGSMTAKEKKQAYEKIASGEANVIIGTHAIIQEKVLYKNLALVVTDEQHRFGVKQREALADKGLNPHILVMSATPIPRTLAIILYGDLKVSIIDELPADRKPIKNCVVNTNYRATAYKFITGQVKEGRQVYIICPMVEEGELEDVENVIDYTEKLKATLAPEIQIAYLHGKMRPADKNRIMEDFAAHRIDVLVSTTVIEVGINVPNATVMMVENAERFGLAQLHQLRGRVGRGEYQSYCIFVSAQAGKDTMERLQILNHSNDGFYIANEDLKLRGPGDLFGIRQSGEFAFRIGDIYNDASVLHDANRAVDELMAEDPLLRSPENKGLRDHLLDISSSSVDFRTI